MLTERRCLLCGERLDRRWTRSNQIYCDESCKRSYYNITKLRPYYAARYQKLKKQWEHSSTGKLAGVPIREWLKMPKEWR